jgi:hypothetical protein
MSNTRDTGFLRNAIQVTDQGVTFVSGSTTLMSISSSGAITTTGVISGSNALSASYSISGSYAVSSSYAYTASSAVSASYILNAVSSSYAYTASSATNATSASKAVSASYSDTASFSNNFTVLGNLTVYGTQSVQYITSSQLNVSDNVITVNVASPGVRFGGLSVFDSGSLSSEATASLFWDSQNNHWIYQRESGSIYTGGMLISGPRNSGGLGNELGTTNNSLMKGQGGDHITSSAIFEVSGSVTMGTAITNNHVITGSIALTGSIGIGTTPAADFPLRLRGGGSTRIKLETAPTLAGALDFYNDSVAVWSMVVDNTQTYAKIENRALSIDAIRFYSSSNNVVLTPTTGNVGIGTTNPTQKVEIQAPANLWATRFIGANVASQSYGFYVDAGTNATDTNAMFRSNGGNSVYFYIGGNGKVGVGTSSPDRLLTVNGDSNLLGNNYISTSKFFQWEGGAYWTTRVTSTGNQFEIYRGDTGVSPFTITSTNLVQVSNTTQTDDLGLIQAYNPTVASTSAANAGLTVKSYNGTGQFMMWENYGMRIGSRIKTNTGAGGIYFTYGADTVGMAIASDGTILAGGASATGAYSFSLGNATANTYYQVRSANTNALYGADTRGTWIGNLSSKETYSNGGHFVPGVDNTVYCGSSSYRWAAVFAVNGAIQTSDQRLKTNIQTSDLGLDFITQLNPVSYKWIVGGSTVEYSSTEDENGKLTPTSVATPFAGRRTHYGLIAQQVKQVLGDKDFGGYVYDEETDTMSLRYDQFISPLIKAIQELKAENDSLKEILQRNNIN